jgi:hypothetical protein
VQIFLFLDYIECATWLFCVLVFFSLTLEIAHKRTVKTLVFKPKKKKGPKALGICVSVFLLSPLGWELFWVNSWTHSWSECKKTEQANVVFRCFKGDLLGSPPLWDLDAATLPSGPHPHLHVTAIVENLWFCKVSDFLCHFFFGWLLPSPSHTAEIPWLKRRKRIWLLVWLRLCGTALGLQSSEHRADTRIPGPAISS